MKSAGDRLCSGMVLVGMMAALPPSGPWPLQAAVARTAAGSGLVTMHVRHEAVGSQPPAGPTGSMDVDGEGRGAPGFGTLCPTFPGAPWSTKLQGTTTAEYVGDVTTDDEACAIYVVGGTHGSLAGSAGMSDAFLARYSTSGALVWIRQFGTALDDWGAGVATDSQHNVYVTGYTHGTLPGSPNANQGGADIYLTKYDRNGNRLWTRQVGSGASDYAMDVAVDDNDEVVIVGNTDGTVPGAGGSVGGTDYLLVRYDTNGNVVDLLQHGTSADDAANGVAIGVAGNIYIAGETTGALAGPSAGLRDLFVAKYTASFGLLWAQQRGTSASDSARGIAVNAEGQVFVCGYTSGSLDGHPNQGQTDAVLLRYDANGTWVWTDQRGTSTYDFANAVAVSADGGPYTTGFTGGSLDGNVHAGDDDLFVMRHGKAGAWRWTRQVGTEAHDLGSAIAVNSADNIYAAGYTLGDLNGMLNAGTWDAFAIKFDSAGIIR